MYETIDPPAAIAGGANAICNHEVGDGIMERAKLAPVEDYFIIIKRCADHRKTPQTHWTWEIQRRSKPLGIKLDGDEYATAQDAKLAGETALKDFLHNLQS
jgi:hypothetical protein